MSGGIGHHPRGRPPGGGGTELGEQGATQLAERDDDEGHEHDDQGRTPEGHGGTVTPGP